MKWELFGRRLKRTLLTGFFIVAPVSLTFILLTWFVALVDSIVAPLFGFIGRPIPGLGLISALLIVLAAGVVGSNLAGQHALELAEDFLLKIPGFNWLYGTIKQMSDVFSPANHKNFSSVVIIEYPRPGVYSVGFVTGGTALESGAERRDLVAVYVPTNHMYIGDTVLVPADKVTYTDMAQQQGFQAMISAGAALPPTIRAVAPPQKEAGPL